MVIVYSARKMSQSQLPLTFDAQGLVPVVVQDHLTGEIRMVAFATNEAVRNTIRTGRATFWSRSRGELWEKGRMSGNDIRVLRVLVDCDADCVVYSSDPHGNSCHTGAESCFFQALEGDTLGQASQQPQTLLAVLESVLEARKTSTGKASYTKSLYDGGADAIGAKIREEADEFACALGTETDERVANEAADVVYHMLVGLRSRNVPLRRVLLELERRLGTSGHEEKRGRSPEAPPKPVV
jgi:phosphoribosyl-ATP pyrophosphohydrolase/phosphoribosyl-AMP cyclohydrolase